MGNSLGCPVAVVIGLWLGGDNSPYMNLGLFEGWVGVTLYSF